MSQIEQKDEDEDVGGSTDENTLENFPKTMISLMIEIKYVIISNQKITYSIKPENGISKEDGVNFQSEEQYKCNFNLIDY